MHFISQIWLGGLSLKIPNLVCSSPGKLYFEPMGTYTVGTYTNAELAGSRTGLAALLESETPGLFGTESECTDTSLASLVGGLSKTIDTSVTRVKIGE